MLLNFWEKQVVEEPNSKKCIIKGDKVVCYFPCVFFFKKMQFDVGNEPTLSLQCVNKVAHIYESVLLISP